MIHPNSKLAYEEKVKPELNKWQQHVFESIKKWGEITSKEVAIDLGTELHKISGRFGELRDKGKIEAVGNRNGYTIWRVKPEPPKMEPGVQSRMNF